eukprot:TRINITY_DN5268_c5_g1_i1.p1 TRINITY_DN5268_c5_g1~~TRINITY_DN5268_c5_g1_i1.p1  ORF type:complete len:237 (-),score=40.42 TRINITY_DN5268_c5_g1_i1:265-975(-)
MVCSPATQFCCGCRIIPSTWFILGVHFLINSFIIVATMSAIFFPEHAIADLHHLGLEVFLAAYSLAGLPFILFGVLGLSRKDEVCLRGYAFYLLLSVIMAIFFIVQDAMTVSCSRMPASVKEAGAFMCGLIDITSTSTGALLSGILLYILYAVWSACEDLRTAGFPKFADLEDGFYAHQAKTLHEASHYMIRSDFDKDYGSVIGHSQSGWGGNQRIFGNTHELQYPPPRKTFQVLN